MTKQFIAIDTETYKVIPGLLAPKLVCVSVSDGKYAKLYDRSDGLKVVWDLLHDPNICLTGQNISYDMAVCAVQVPQFINPIFEAFQTGRIYDTRIDQQLIDIATGDFEYFEYKGKKHANKHSLQQYVLRWLDENIQKGKDSWQLRFGELDGIPISQYPSEAYNYAVGDALKTWHVNDRQLSFAGSYIPTRELQTQAAWALHLMAIQGVRTNKQRTLDFRDSLKEKFSSVQNKLLSSGFLKPKAGGYSRDLASIRQAVIEAYGSDVPLTKGKQVSTSKDALKASKNPELTLVSEYVHLEKQLQTFLPLLLQATEVPFNPGWNTLVTSGRTSCGGEEAVGNMQNLPRAGEERECFEPREGNYYCSTDLDTAELRSLSEVNLDLFGYSVMADELNRGFDPHLAFAAEIMGITYEQAEANKNDKEVKRHRQFGKIYNFGAPGGQQPPSLVEYAKGYNVEIDIHKAKEVYGNWINHYLEMKDFFAYNKKLTGFNSVTYKHHKTGFVRADMGYTELCNFHFQHLTACAAKQALWLITKECYLNKESPLYGSRPVLFLHDEVICEVPIAKSHEASYRQAELMVEGANAYVKKIKNSCSPALMDRWYKEAKEKFDDAGKLIPWSPT